ncbi:MAG TPA: amidohydrolase family protein [Vicinamibacterales bacterium]|nr:amidohydrolase family protein [Vicinamibacterales bacterium]
MSSREHERVIDACVLHDWSSITDLVDYMTPGWREMLLRRGSRAGPNELKNAPLYRPPSARKAADAYPANGVAGSDLALTATHVLDQPGLERAVLGYDQGALLAMGFTNMHAAATVAQAANEWTMERWLTKDPRLQGLILVATALPHVAAEEVRRVGGNDKMVGVALGVNGLAMPFGHPVYHPIYEAASEHGLPLVIQVGSDTGVSLMAAPVGGGVAATYAEIEAWSGHPLMSHLTSMIFEGVFELFPNLKVLLVGGGVSWIPGFVWRLDFWFNYASSEAPLLKERPSDYFRRHARIATYSLEPSSQGRLARALETLPWLRDVLVYGSGYPNIDWEKPAATAERLPSEWRSDVLYHNASSLFRWPDNEFGDETHDAVTAAERS